MSRLESVILKMSPLRVMQLIDAMCPASPPARTPDRGTDLQLGTRDTSGIVVVADAAVHSSTTASDHEGYVRRSR